jgi:imidazole glycerol-phosphate synthase subunit HisH
MKVAIIDYGAGNITSLSFALERLGVKEIAISNKKDVIEEADKVIFPGVGHATYAMKQLRDFGLDAVIPNLKQPVLGICLGMQLMCAKTEEGNEEGLGIFQAHVKKFEPLQKVPHMGWNTVDYSHSPFIEEFQLSEWYYFVHSFYAEISSETIGKTDYINSFSAVMHKDNFIGCQFHPEKSGPAGKKFLQQFLSI